ncbi:MAG: hypothetical protein AAGI09_06690 [Pseudomonadota bacterium]
MQQMTLAARCAQVQPWRVSTAFTASIPCWASKAFLDRRTINQMDECGEVRSWRFPRTTLAEQMMDVATLAGCSKKNF